MLVQKKASPVPMEQRRSLTFVFTLLMTLNQLGSLNHGMRGDCGKGTLGKKLCVCTDDVSFKKLHYAVLQQSSLVDLYIEEHKKIFLSKYPEKSEVWIIGQHLDTFARWLRKHLMHNMDIGEQLFLLGRGPFWNILMHQDYEINGNTFYTRAQDKKSTNHF